MHDGNSHKELVAALEKIHSELLGRNEWDKELHKSQNAKGLVSDETIANIRKALKLVGIKFLAEGNTADGSGAVPRADEA